MINNRQAGRRNRGRNNGRPNGGNRGGGDNGNRIDSRARGNATQLLEKYKNMARDAQMAGDRVNTEYYLQFADHYFRVLADNRARQDEQQQRFRRPDESFEDEGEDFDASEDALDEGRAGPSQDRSAGDGRNGAENRAGSEDRGRRDRGRRERPVRAAPVEDNHAASGEDAAQQAPVVQAESVAVEPRPEAESPVEPEAAVARPRRGRPRKVNVEAAAGEQEGLDLAVLPPSIARADNDSDEPAEAPRKRTRRPRSATEAAE
ncbi:MAG: DUF4167 domain-containing protein [Sphingobium sp.]